MIVTVELRQPGEGPSRIPLSGPVEIGREGDGIRVRDRLVSRRHALLTPSPDGLVVQDLGSTHGTLVDGQPITGRTVAGPGQVVGIGLCDVTVTAVQPSAAATPTLTPPGDLSHIDVPGGQVAFRPGTAGQRFAPGVADALATALGWLGELAPASGVQVLLLDPFPHPHDPSTRVGEGAVVSDGTVWLVATPEVPPSTLHRWVALAAAAHHPAGAELAHLWEAYGLLADGLDPADHLPAGDAPPLGTPGDAGVLAAASFVGHLIQRDGEGTFRALLAQAVPGRVDAQVASAYGEGMAKLEREWRTALVAPEPTVDLRAFLRLAWQQVRPYRAKEAESLLHTVLGLAFTLAFPFVFRALVDTAIPAADFGQIWTLLGILAAAFLVSIGGQVRRSYLGADVSGRVVRDLRAQMFARLQVLSRGWHDTQDPGDLLSRFFSDIGQLEAGLTAVVREGVVNVVSLVVAATVLLVLQPILAVVVIAGAPVVAIVYRRMSATALTRSTAVQRAAGDVLGVARENQEAREVVTAYGLEDRERSRFAVASERLRGAELGLNLFTGFFALSVNSILIVLRLAVLGLGAWLITRGNLTLGGLVAFVSVMNEVLDPAAALSQVGQQVQNSTGALVRIDEVLQAPIDIAAPEQPTPLPPLRQDITLEDVTFAYPGAPATLRGLSCRIPAGSRVAFVGPSGAGKSTVLRLLTREYDPQEGTIAIDGVPLPAADPADLRAMSAVVFQRTFLFDTTIRENVRLGRLDATDAEVAAAAAAAALDTSTFPDGLDTLVGNDGARVSGGQAQRLAIARAILRNPRLLVLDEATSALDPATERAVARTLADAGAGRTVVTVTHRLSTITDHDRIFVLVAGQLAEQGRHEELLAAGGVYARLWAEQAGEEVAAAEAVDPVAALATVGAFASLGKADLAVLAGLLRRDMLATDEELEERPGRLAVLLDGSAEVLVPTGDGDGSGRRVRSAVLGAGELFGVAALTGEAHGAVLRARQATTLLVLDPAVLARAAGEHPAIAQALQQADGGVGPTGGLVRSARLTVA